MKLLCLLIFVLVGICSREVTTTDTPTTDPNSTTPGNTTGGSTEPSTNPSESTTGSPTEPSTNSPGNEYFCPDVNGSYVECNATNSILPDELKVEGQGSDYICLNVTYETKGWLGIWNKHHVEQCTLELKENNKLCSEINNKTGKNLKIEGCNTTIPFTPTSPTTVTTPSVPTTTPGAAYSISSSLWITSMLIFFVYVLQ